MENIKVHVPTEEISKLVQEKLFEKGCRWLSGVNFVQYSTNKYMYVEDCRIIAGDTESYFSSNDNKQVHYLQVLADDYEGQLFSYNKDVYYQDSKGYAHWIEDYNQVYRRNTEYEICSKDGSYTLLDVNEQPIIKEETMENNTMPELEAGKHLIETEDGSFGLILADGICAWVRENEYRPEHCGWSSIANLGEIIRVYKIHRHGISWKLLPIQEGGCHTLIWSKPEAPTQREIAISEYEDLCDQINALKVKADELKEKL